MSPGIFANPLILKNTKIRNKINPSKNASYNCDGCRNKLSTWTNFTAQGRLVSTPYNSEFIKLAILQKIFQLEIQKKLYLNS